MSNTSFPWRLFIIVLLVALADRLFILASGAVSFHADEAVVGLMARHILDGARPTFFYGQAYMGSLDAWLIAVGFRFLGDSVMTIRVVQSALYVLVVAVSFMTAWRLSGRRVVALVAGLVVAVPPVNTVLYTTATLGGYNETLLFGGLILLLSYEVTHPTRTTHESSLQGVFQRYWQWGLLGLCVGLGWWTNGLIVVYVLPAALLILYRLLRRQADSSQRSAFSNQQLAEGSAASESSENADTEVFTQSSALSPQYLVIGMVVAVVLFVVGSAPWWVFDFTHDHAALATYITNRQSGEFAGIGLPYVPPTQRALGLAFIGLPALVGLRFPWESAYFFLPLGIVVVLIHLFAIYRLLRGHNPLKPDARGLMLGMLCLFCAVFVASSFGADPTGRYFLPLLLPLGIVLGAMAESFRSSVSSRQLSANEPPVSHEVDAKNSELGTRNSHLETRNWKLIACYACVGLVLVYHLAGQIAAVVSEVGITTQFDLVSHIPNDHDDELIAFLDEHGLYTGYTNYWVAFRLAFLTDEQMQYSSALPYKTNLDYNPADNRYPPYPQAADAAENGAIITTMLPELDARITERLAAEGITYQETTIGVFHIYYNFQPGIPRPPFV